MCIHKKAIAMEEAKAKISPYIAGIKDRKIKQIISRYLDTYSSFKEYNQSFHEGVIMSYSNLRKVHDILWEIKENFHLVYKRQINLLRQTVKSLS
jgi:hypothetical protein